MPRPHLWVMSLLNSSFETTLLTRSNWAERTGALRGRWLPSGGHKPVWANECRFGPAIRIGASQIESDVGNPGHFLIADFFCGIAWLMVIGVKTGKEFHPRDTRLREVIHVCEVNHAP